MGPINRKRCFAFGCSYTDWLWPTAADLIGCNFEEYYNFGRSGCDNTYIQNRVIETLDYFKLNQDDFVVIGITGMGRFTYWDIETDWMATGDIFPSLHDPESKISKFSNQMYNKVWAVYRSVLAIKTMKSLLVANKIPHVIYPALDNVGYYVKQHYDITNPNRREFVNIAMKAAEDTLKLFDVATSIDEVIRKVGNTKITFAQDPNYHDAHPTTATHYHYLQKYFPDFDTPLVKNIVYKFSKKSYANQEELKEYMVNNFILKHRKEMKIDQSLFFKHYNFGTDVWRKYREII